MWRAILFLKNKPTILLLIAGLLLFFSCTEKEDKALQRINQSQRVARAGAEILYEDEVANLEKRATKADSLVLRERFINNWIRKELLLQKAKLNLSEEEQNVEKLVENYRASLLINQYKQKYLREHLDTIVMAEDVNLFIAEHAEDFRLKTPLLRYYLAKVATKNKHDIAFIRNLFSKKEIDLMQDFDLASSTVISNNDEGWYTLKDLLNFLPNQMKETDLSTKLRERKLFEIQSKDKEYTYFVFPLKIIKAGKMSPVEYLNEKVTKMILHKRKLALAKQLEYEIYEDAKEKNEFEVY